MKQFFINLWQFLKSRTFLINFGISVVVGALLVWLIFGWLSMFTRHGKTVVVPDFANVTIAQLPGFVQDKDVKFEITDSIFEPGKPKGIVYRQDPIAGDHVKPGRTIYLSVTSVLPPKIAMPKLEESSLRLAIALLHSHGLELLKPKYVKDASCNGCVVKQLFNGKRIETGTMIEKGSKIELWIGSGADGDADNQVGVPDLVGKTFCEAKPLLEGKGLSWTIVPIGGGKLKDTCSAYVVRQTPAPGGSRTVSVGQSIDLYLTNDRSKIISPIDSLDN